MTEVGPSKATSDDNRCAWCSAPLAGRRLVQLAGSSTITLCSEDCLREKLRSDAQRRRATRLRIAQMVIIASAFVAACITPHQAPPSLRRHLVQAARPTAPKDTPDTAPLPGAFGPEWPPTEASMLAELGRDAWLHPLAGPFRRMPASDSRVFGAERPGDRPIECRRGHCGVDLGGEIWGEHVHAAHDGVVDRVQRAVNEQHGGHYVRIAHHDGTVFTQYFHLAAIPRWLQPGVPVKAGQLIGLLGDTGVKESSAHLHFTVSVRPIKNGPEQYMDPEPLVALWPLRIPVEHSPVTVITTTGKPGVPLGSMTGGPARKREAASRKQAAKTARTHADKASRTRAPDGDQHAPEADDAKPEPEEPAPEPSAE